ncbi:unnamed protein product [Sphagnum balticum]
MHASMVVNQLECCGNSSSSSLKKKKMVLSEAHAPTETSFVARSPSAAAAPPRSPYTWLDKLRFLKGFPEEPRVELSEFLTSLAVKNSTSSSLPKLPDSKTFVAAAAPPMVQQQQQLASRTVVKASATNGIFYMDLGATEANGNASEMEIQKWGIKARTSRLNATVLPYDHHQNTTITTTVCASNCCMGGELYASTAAGIADSKQRNNSPSKLLDSSFVNAGGGAPRSCKPPQLLIQASSSPVDLFGMEDRRSSSSDSRKKLSRKGNKLSFLPQSCEQLGKEEEDEEEAAAMDSSSGERRNNKNHMQTQSVQVVKASDMNANLVHQGRRPNPSFLPPPPPRAALLPLGCTQGVSFVSDGFKNQQQQQQQHGVWSSEEHDRGVALESTGKEAAYKGGARSSINKKLAKRLRTTVAATPTLAAAAASQQLKRKAVASNQMASSILERRRTGSSSGNFLNNNSRMAGKKRRANSELLLPQMKDQACKVLKVGEPWVSVERSAERRSSTGIKSFGAGHDGGCDLGKGPSPQEAPVLELASDHPSKKSKDSLVYITYQVFLQAGKTGLTAREAASRIIDCGLADIFHGLVKPRIKIGKIIRNNPYYFQAGEGRYILFEAIVGVTQTVSIPHPPTEEESAVAPLKSKPQKEIAPTPVDARKEAAAMARRNGTARYWAQMHANGWTRGQKGRNKKLEMGKSTPAAASTKISGRPVKSGDTDQKLVQSEEHTEQNSAQEQVVQGQLKHWLNDTVHIGMGRKQCRRTDGKNWQCPERAVSGTNYCGNHQYRMKQAVETKGVFRTPLLKDKDETNERHIEGYEEVQDQNTEHGNLID